MHTLHLSAQHVETHGQFAQQHWFLLPAEGTGCSTAVFAINCNHS